MKRKLAAAIVVVMISMGLLACGSNASAPTDTVETAAETEAPEEITSGEEENTEAGEEADEEVEVEDEEVLEQEESTPEWYMDEEGIKSDELGIMIRRDSAEWSQFGFSGSFMICFSDANANTYVPFSFKCNYYAGDIDNYILEHMEMKKETLEDVTYAVREPDEKNTYREVAFVGNGIVFSITLFDHKIEDIWKNGLDFYEEDHADYLAYIRDETLYCPALGIKFSGGKYDIAPNRAGVFCSDAKYTANSSYEGGNIEIYNDNSVLKGNNIEEKLNSYVKNRVDFGDSAIDESVEKNVGNYKFLGKGSSNRYGSETWLLLSDESTYYLQIWYTEKYKLEDYLSVIEELK